MRITTLLPCAAVALTTLVAAAPAAAQDVVAPTTRPAPVAGDGEALLWSAYDATTERWSLNARVDGAIAPLPVAPSGVSFDDADLGRLPDGSLVAVYSRCETDDRPDAEPSGCDLYRYDFATGRERRIGSASSPSGSDTEPTLSGDRLVWLRRYEGRSHAEVVYTRVLGRSGPSRRVPVARTQRTGVEELELSGSRLAAVTFGPSPVGQGRLEVRLGSVRRLATIASRNTGEGGQYYFAPSFDGGGLYFATGCVGDPSGCSGGHVDRYGLRDHGWRQAPAPIDVDGFARAGGHSYWSAVDQAGDDECPSAGCGIVDAGPQVFAPVARP